MGIPAGGLFTEANGLKTAAETQRWAGTTGDPYDPCYHAACDTYDNINLTAMRLNAGAAADSVIRWAMAPVLPGRPPPAH